MTKNIPLMLASVVAAAATFSAPFAVPALGIDQIVRLYMCQTEHELEEITAWEYSDPARFREATKSGTIMPLDAARDRAAFMVSTDRIICDAGNRFAIEKQGNGGTGSPAVMAVMEGPELEAYCPRTIKKHGHPCK